VCVDRGGVKAISVRLESENVVGADHGASARAVDGESVEQANQSEKPVYLATEGGREPGGGRGLQIVDSLFARMGSDAPPTPGPRCRSGWSTSESRKGHHAR
jgi:hypothetical protein